jgi:hypothetical protein
MRSRRTKEKFTYGKEGDVPELPKGTPQSGSDGILLTTSISGGRMAAQECWIKESSR